MAGAYHDDEEEITSINVTPLVDITLVLLIIFMVTTTVISRTDEEGLGIDKPEASTGTKIEGESILIMCDESGAVLVDGEAVEGDRAITEKITDKLVEDRELQGIVLCDEEAQVGKMVHLIDLMRDAGVKKYAIATKKPEAAGG